MKYKIEIHGMHCLSCGTLIGLLFEDRGVDSFSLNQSDSTATFDSDESMDTVRKMLGEIFAEATKYSYSKLETVESE